MKTKLLKIIFSIAAIMCCVSANAIVFIPIEGTISYKYLIAIWIALNIPSILIVIIRSLIWLIKRPDWAYIDYVWLSDKKFLSPLANSMWLAIVNGLGIIVTLVFWVETII